MQYELLIKSHREAPDYESEVEADSLEEAVEHFYKELKGEFDRETIKKNMSYPCRTCDGVGYIEELGNGDNFEVDVIGTKPCPDCRG